MKVKPMPLKKEPIKDLVPEFKENESLQKLAEVSRIKIQMDAVANRRDSAKSMLGGITEHFEGIIDKLHSDGITELEIVKFTEEQIESYYVQPDGQPIEIHVPMRTHNDEIEFKRDYLSMLINNRTAFHDIDVTMAELAYSMQEYDEEIRKIHADTNGDIIKYVRSELNKQPVESNPHLAKNIQDINKAIDHSYNLEPLIEYFSKLDPRNTISDYVHRSDIIFKKFVKNCRVNGIVVNYKRLELFEARYLDRRFHKYSDFLTFLVYKMFSFKKEFTRLDSIFLLQLNSNLQILFYEKERGLQLNEVQEAERALMVQSAEKLLSLFM